MINYQLLANAIRILSIDAVEKAQSGHPGMPMGMADIATVLWKKHLKHNPKNPTWINRDRFILSNGHGSMLLYSLLHLTGYDLSLDDIKHFRQLHSNTPGHPENILTKGVETTTGPLGQGLANAVGMALAEKLLSSEFNKDIKIIDHYTYVFVGDGCLMEGISHEVCSLAGTLKLNKLIVIYDQNGISIDGEIAPWYSENVALRFKSYNWNVIDNINGHNVDEIDRAIEQAQDSSSPTIIICKTVIGFGSPNKSGKEESHGAPLGAKEIENVRKQLNWPINESFKISDEIYESFDCKESGKKLENDWNNLFKEYKTKYPHLAKELTRRVNHILPDNFEDIIKNGILEACQQNDAIATRKASLIAINYYVKSLPEMLGGSADLTGSNLTKWNGAISLNEENHFTGNYIHYGVREFGMSAIMNGIYLYGGYKVFGGTFLMFVEYAKNATRMAALMKIAPIFVYTHDSIGLGEDGPTHQPIEQIAGLRLIPNMDIWRPCDLVETMIAWGVALNHNNKPTSLIFSRQNLPQITNNYENKENIFKGGYILKNNAIEPDVLIIATGSEVHLALAIYDILSKSDKVQLVSMPSTSTFDLQDNAYKNKVLSKAKFKIAIEAGVSDTWYKYVGNNGLIIGINTFGESAKANDLFEYFNLTSAKIMLRINEYLNKK